MDWLSWLRLREPYAACPSIEREFIPAQDVPPYDCVQVHTMLFERQPRNWVSNAFPKYGDNEIRLKSRVLAGSSYTGRSVRLTVLHQTQRRRHVHVYC